MATVLQLSFTGESEAFLEEMANENVPFQDVIGRALWLLKTAHKTRCVGILRPDWANFAESEQIVDQIIIAVDPMITQRDIPVGPPVSLTREIDRPTQKE